MSVDGLAIVCYGPKCIVDYSARALRGCGRFALGRSRPSPSAAEHRASAAVRSGRISSGGSMDDIEGEDFDTIVRLKCLDLVDSMAERACAMGNFIITDPECLIEAASLIEHYATNGGTIEFNCTETLRPTVRGGI